jgi:hypothetical protein
MSSAPTTMWPNLNFLFSNCTIFIVFVWLPQSYLKIMVGGFSNFGFAVIQIGWPVKLITKLGNSKFSQISRLDAHTNLGRRTWCSIKRTPFDDVLCFNTCSLYGGIITGIFLKTVPCIV